MRPEVSNGLFRLEFGRVGESDRRFLRRSGVSSSSKYGHFSFPRVWCSRCRNWGHSGAGRLVGPEVDALGDEGLPGSLPVREWRALAKSWARTLGLEVARIKPGIELGLPHGVAARVKLDPVVSPSQGWFWFSGSLVEEIRDAGFTGCDFHEVVWVGQKRPREAYFELEPRGSVRHHRSPRTFVRCTICRRLTDIKHREGDAVWLESWTGDDFCWLENLNENVVSRRAFALLQQRSENVFGFELRNDPAKRLRAD